MTVTFGSTIRYPPHMTSALTVPTPFPDLEPQNPDPPTIRTAAGEAL